MSNLTYPAHPHHTDFWLWEACYHDGTSLLEVTGDKLNHFHDIDHSQLKWFKMHPLLPHLPRFSVDLTGDKRLIMLRRRNQQMSLNGDELGPGASWTIIGWQETKNETNFKVYLYINENGSAFLTDEHDAIR